MTDSRTDQQRADARKIQSVVTSLVNASRPRNDSLTDEHYGAIYRYAVAKSRADDADVIATLGLPPIGSHAHKAIAAPTNGLDLSCLPAGVGHAAGAPA